MSSTANSDLSATMNSEPSSYRVYLGKYLTWKDTHHHAIYVETDEVNEEGVLYHAVGSVLRGMKLDIRTDKDPLRSDTGVSRQQIGWVTKQNHHRMQEVCLTIPPPAAQLALNGKKLNPSQPIRHCQHWVAEAIDALKAEGVLDPLGPTDDAGIQFRSPR